MASVIYTLPYHNQLYEFSLVESYDDSELIGKTYITFNEKKYVVEAKKANQYPQVTRVIEKCFEQYQIDDLEEMESSFKNFSLKSALCLAKKNPLKISEIINQFQLNETDRIQICKIAASQNGKVVAKYIKNYRIKDKDALIDIAFIIAKQTDGYISKYIKNFEIQDPNIKKQIAKIDISHNSSEGYVYIDNYEINDQETLVEISLISAKNNGWITSHNIKKYAIADEESRVKIAKVAAFEDPEGLSKYINNYEISNPTSLFEIAKILACQTNGYVHKFIKQCNITDQNFLVEIAYLQIKYDPENLVETIHLYKIKNHNILINIAKNLAAHIPSLLSENIDNFKIHDNNALFEIATISAYHNSLGTIINIDNYSLKKEDFENIIEICKINVWLHIYEIPLVSDEINNIDFDLYPFLNLIIDILKIEHLPLDNEILNAKYESICKFLLELNTDSSWLDQVFYSSNSVVKKQLLKWVMPLIGLANTIGSNFKVFYEQAVPFLSNLAKTRNTMIKNHLTTVLIELCANNKLFDITSNEKKSKHLYLPILALSFLNNEELKKFYKEILEKINRNRKIFRNVEIINPFLEMIILLEKDENLSLSHKANFLRNCFLQDESNFERTFLSARDLLAFGYGYKLKNISNNKMAATLESLIEEVFKINFSTDISNFRDKYLATIKKFRMPNAIFTYSSRLKLLPSEEIDLVLPYLKTYVTSVLEKDFKDRRYDISKSEHLKTIFTQFPTIRQEWINGDSVDLADLLELSLNTTDETFNPDVLFDFIKDKLLSKNLVNIPFENYIHLNNVIKNTNNLSDELKKIDQKINSLLKSAKETGVSKETYTSLKEKRKVLDIELLVLRVLSSKTKEESIVLIKTLIKKLKKDPFVNDLNHLIVFLAQENSPINDYKVVDTDDPCDLLLVGTEVNNSCQSVDADPKLNKALVGYLMDGKHRIIAVKNRDGKLAGRSIIRLLWNKVTEKPVLFLETVYTSNNDPVIVDAIIAMSKRRALKLGIDIMYKQEFHQNNTKIYYDEIVALPSQLAPFEYVDANKNILTAPYSINCCKLEF